MDSMASNRTAAFSTHCLTVGVSALQDVRGTLPPGWYETPRGPVLTPANATEVGRAHSSCSATAKTAKKTAL